MQEIRRELNILTLIEAIFKCATEKMRLAAVLPSLILNPELSVILTIDEMDIINDVFLCNIEFCPKYLSQSISNNENSKTNVCIKETWYDISRFHHAVYKALKILYKYISVLYKNLRHKHISITSALFLSDICYFLEHVLCRMYLMPEEERNKELHYRKLWHCQKKCIEDITRFTMDLETQRINNRKMLEDMVKRYKKNLVTIDDIDIRYNEYVTNTNTRYEKKQIVVCKAWEYERNEMQVSLKNVIDDLEFLKDVHLKFEHTIRKQKLMTELKLLTILTKYDTEIGSKCRTLEKLSEVYKHDKLKKHNLEKEMKQQEEIYLTFIKRKEEAEITNFYKSLATFERARSAKIIQRWWRKIVWNRKEKKAIEKERK